MKNMARFYMIFGISILIITIIGSTFAYYVWNTSSDKETKIVTNIGAATVYFDGGSSIDNAIIRPVSDKSKGIVKEIGVKANTSGININMYLDITTLPDALKEESFKYAFYNGTTLLQEGNFTTDYLSSNTEACSTNDTTHIILLSNKTVSTSLTTYILYIWIDGLNYENPNTMMNQTFSFKLHADGTGGMIKEGKIPDITETISNSFAYKLVQDYINSEKTDVTNNGILYHYDTTHNLMTDIAGNVRYYGASPNNYIYFNCSDYSNQTQDTCEIWRIIGVFEGKVKIMRNASIGSYSWDNKNDSTGGGKYGYNVWTKSRLMKLLNPTNYYTIDSNDNGLGQSLYYNSESGMCYRGQNNATVSCNFTSTGIKNDATRNMISEVVWNLGGWKETRVYSDQMYEYERGKIVCPRCSTLWTGKIALAYPSDYGYAADFRSCTKQLGGYGSSTCTSVNWMRSISGTWLLTSDSDFDFTAWAINSSGAVLDYQNTPNSSGVVPVLYLSSQLEIKSGDGSSSLPYQLQQ